MMKTNKTISEKNKISEIKSINKASEKYKQRNIGIYIHIPFCVSKCFYCDFVSFPGIKEEIKYLYVESLLKETEQGLGARPKVDGAPLPEETRTISTK